MKNKLKLYIYAYDPANFGAIYSIKAVLSLLISLVISYFTLGLVASLLSIQATIGIYFLTPLDGKLKERVFYLFLFSFLCLIFIFLETYFNKLNFWAFIPIFFWFFISSMSSIYSENLHKVLMSSTFSSIIIYASKDTITNSGLFDTYQMMGGFIIGSLVGIGIRIINFTGYGEFTKKNFNVILDDLKLLNSTENEKEFKFWQNKTISTIDNLKNIFSKQSVNFKDSKLIKNQTRAIFYLYKMEEILYLISAIREKYFGNNKRKMLFKRLKKEIDYNLNEIKNLFIRKPVNFKFKTYNRIKKLKEMPIFMASLDALYNQFNLTVAGGEEKIVLKTKNEKFSFKKLKIILNSKNTLFQYSFKFATAISSGIFITNFFNISRGMWVSLGVITVMRIKVDNIKDIVKDTIISTILGIAFGTVVVFLFNNTPLFFITTPMMLFLLFYLKSFPYSAWNFALVVNLSIFFSIISNDFSDLIVFRFLSMCFGFFIAFLVSKLLWPVTSKDEIMPNFKQNISNLSILIENIIKTKNSLDVRDEISKTVKHLNDFNDLIKESKKNSYQELYDSSMNITLNLFKLTNYLKSIKTDNYDIIKNDLTIIKRRFDMICNKLNNLPFYFYQNSENLFLSKDKKIVLLLQRIAKAQEKIYLSLS